MLGALRKIAVVSLFIKNGFWKKKGGNPRWQFALQAVSEFCPDYLPLTFIF